MWITGYVRRCENSNYLPSYAASKGHGIITKWSLFSRFYIKMFSLYAGIKCGIGTSSGGNQLPCTRMLPKAYPALFDVTSLSAIIYKWNKFNNGVYSENKQIKNFIAQFIVI